MYDYSSTLLAATASLLLYYRAYQRVRLLASRDSEVDFLRAISKKWQSETTNAIVVKAGQAVQASIEHLVPSSNLLSECQCSTPPLPFGVVPATIWTKLSWKIPSTLSVEYKQLVGNKMKSAMVIGDTQQFGACAHSEAIYMGIMWLAPNTHYPAHAHEASEFFHILSGTAQWTQGEEDVWETCRPGDFRHHAPGVSHSVKTTDDALVALYYWYGNITGKYWFNSLVVETEEDLLKGAYDNLDNTRAYYDHLSQKYDEVVVKKWGYNMPSCVAKMCVEVLRIPLSARVLDLGCGSGLVGAELQKHGYNAFTGVDISEASLRIAKGRNVYVRLKVGNLSECLVPKVLPRESMFNLLVCVGTTSYLSPDVLNGWSRLVRPGGILVLTHKTEVWKIWEPIQNELVRRGILEHVITSEEMLYLPGFSVNSRENERAKIYAFRRPKSSS